MTSAQVHNNLVAEFKKGNPRAFDQLFYLYNRRLYSFLFHLTRSTEDAEEILQHTFVRVWEKRDLYNEQYPFDAFLFKVAKNAFLNHARKKINQRIAETHLGLYSEMMDDSVDDYLALKETSSLIEALVEAMPPQRQQVFRMQKFEGLSRKEISEKLNISVVTIDSHLAKANKDLLEGLKRFSILAIMFWIS